MGDGPHLDFIKNKLELLLNYSTNILAYLMFKSRGTNMTLHPVTGRLVQYRQILDSLQHLDEIVMPQVESLLARIDSNESVESIIKKEKKKLKKQLNPISVPKTNNEGKIENSKKKRKRKASKTVNDDLTMDERMAVQLFKATKKSKVDSDESDEDLDGNELVDDVSDKEVDNDANEIINDGQDEEQEEKRAITYTIAKNKGLMPKR